MRHFFDGGTENFWFLFFDVDFYKANSKKRGFGVFILYCEAADGLIVGFGVEKS